MLSAHALIDGTLYHRFSLIFFALAAALILSPAIQVQTEAPKALRASAWSFASLTTAGTVLTAASFWAFFSAGVPESNSLRATFARAFPAPLTIIEGGQILDRWAADWHRSGQVRAATDLALWTEKHGNTPWTTMALMADWMIGDGEEKAGYTLKRQAALSEPEDWKAPSLSFIESTDSDAR
jgi:hypothetical protein